MDAMEKRALESELWEIDRRIEVLDARNDEHNLNLWRERRADIEARLGQAISDPKPPEPPKGANGRGAKGKKGAEPVEPTTDPSTPA